MFTDEFLELSSVFTHDTHVVNVDEDTAPPGLLVTDEKARVCFRGREVDGLEEVTKLSIPAARRLLESLQGLVQA